MSEEGLFDRPAQPAGYADGKDPEALRTIGEVAKALGIRQHVLRYWEEQFPMLKPLKRSGGRRYYRTEDVRLVETIDRLVHREGYTLKGAKKTLQTGGRQAAASVDEPTQQASVATPPLSAMSANFALRARLISLRTTLVNALHEA
ncbi:MULTISPECIES: MerR family transcriptional regulator [unclassified Novosphingobium]|uniref:MerR family transcriptional regulator n=1 Tax=unclassified Novosphingobium TaxID=2644732 RepID=UPI0025FB6056|nr:MULTISPECIES: MerR family transcriptional regulator [unclassified Novosphingobium]HQV03977.1 MerR family transcriptional regulator [Novosphingobium sp.]